MAAFPISYKTPYKDQNIPTQGAIKQNDKRFMYDCVNMVKSSSVPGQIYYKFNNILTKSNKKERNAPKSMFHGNSSSKSENVSTVLYSSESSSIEKQLGSLDSYFGKLHHQDTPKLCTLDSSNKAMQVNHRDGQSGLKNGLQSLDEYLGKLNNGANKESHVPSTYIEHYNEQNLAQQIYLDKDTEIAKLRKQSTFVDIRKIKGVRGPRSAMDSKQQDEISSLYLIGILVSINIAVFLFEIASPIRNGDLELFSIPLLYGAKINHLIVIGEWWRLVTPMFLHAGIFHIALSCWALVLFGTQVCRGYGSFTFFLIYILGGISGNLTSFLHTPDPTVGGTGPVFAIIGAWLMYQIQNKDVTANDGSESMIRKAIVVTALSFILSSLGPIDEWTHFGAAFTGMAYGFLTCPTLQLNDASAAGTGQEEGLKLVRKYSDPCKSLVVFTIFLFVLSSLLFFMEPPLNALASVI